MKTKFKKTGKVKALAQMIEVIDLEYNQWLLIYVESK
jgi:hypothetical protein